MDWLPSLPSLASLGVPSLAFDPLVPLPFIIGFGVIALIAALAAGAGRLRSMFLRSFAAIAVIAALLNPQTVEEDRTPLRDIALIISDGSESVLLGTRAEQVNAALDGLATQVSADNTLELVTARIQPDSDGTRLTATLIEALGSIPAARLAGVIIVTDGQIHDLPNTAESLLPDGVPFHAMVIGDPQRRDRRIRATVAPRYGLVGEQAEFQIQVDDPGFEGERAQIAIKLNGEMVARFGAIIGNQMSIPLTIERRGTNTVELIVTEAPDELTIKNNVFVAEISGIRDRLQVLLVTGEPHRGGRAWRNLLKSDPAVDLVHFTILTNPGIKYTNARSDELSLIAFPVRQLFEEKLDEFDLIIFDQFKRRGRAANGRRSRSLLPPIYFQNIAEYVERGGALLVATGPAFATQDSIYRSPLAAVLPSRPTGEILETSFRAKLNTKGERHPITADFKNGEAQSWGPWYRIVENAAVSGNVLMEGPTGEPLLVIDKVREGRVAMLMSDQAWLWAKGYQGGGPYSEMFRRLSHWLMGEPDLAAEKLSARTDGETLLIERSSLGDEAQSVVVQKPDGTSETVTLTPRGDGRFSGSIKTAGQGAYRLSSGPLATVTAIGALNPKEFSDLTPTMNILSPLVAATGGYGQLIGDGTSVPNLRRVKNGAKRAGDNWFGLTAHERYSVEASRRAPLAPGWLFFLLAAVALGWAWRREGQ